MANAEAEAKKELLKRLAAGKYEAAIASVEKLTPTNFLDYQRSINSVAYNRGWHADTLKLRNADGTDAYAAWDGQEEADMHVRLSRREAYAVLSATLTKDTKHLEKTIKIGDAKALWKKVHDRYQKRTMGSSTESLNNFLKMTMANTGMTLEKFITHIEVTAKEVEDKGTDVTTGQKKHVLLNGLLLPEFKTIKQLKSTQDVESCTFEALAADLEAFADNEHLTNVCRGTPSAPTVNYNSGNDKRATIACNHWKRKGYCKHYEQGKCPYGHEENKRGISKRDTGNDDDNHKGGERNKNKNKNKNKFKGKCFACGGDHRVSDCSLIKQVKQQMGNNDKHQDNAKDNTVNNFINMLKQAQSKQQERADTFLVQAVDSKPPVQDVGAFVMSTDKQCSLADD